MLRQTEPTPAADIASTATVDPEVLAWILAFALAALVVLTLAQVHRNWKREDGKVFNTAYGRVFGLTVIASLATILAFANIDAGDKSGAFALLGTIAGYLAATATSAKKPTNNSGGQPGSAGAPDELEDDGGTL